MRSACTSALHSLPPRTVQKEWKGRGQAPNTERRLASAATRKIAPVRDLRPSSIKAQVEDVHEFAVSRQDGDEAHEGGAVVLLFKNDLRLDDHAGLHEALQSGRNVIPFYCLDLALVWSVVRTPGGAELLWGALKGLRMALKSIGSDLCFRMGPLADTTAAFLKEMNAVVVVTETEADFHWRQAMDDLRRIAPNVAVKEWTTRLRNPVSYSQNFREMNGGSSLTDPLLTPRSIESDFANADRGQIPELEHFKAMLTVHSHLQETANNGREMIDPFERKEKTLWQRWSADLTTDSDAPVALLRSYLSLSRHSTKDDAQTSALEEVVQVTEDASFPGISFASLFCGALSLGILSPRRVCYEVKKAKERMGWRSWLVEAPFHKAARMTSESYDFHDHVAQDILINGCDATPGSSSKKFWRWHGILTEYSVAHPADESKGNVILVHGFGASCMHWRRNVDALTEAGYTVYCPSLPGYGRTQKLYMIYSQAVWKSFLTDFITDVVGAPAVLGGNSIGAFVAAQTAALCRDFVSGLVLINPAGPLDPDYVPSEKVVNAFENKPPSIVVDFLAHGLLFYLEKSAGRILRSVYPVRTENADEAFLNELLRASYDPNAIAVLKSVFFLKKPVPLNYLLSEMFCKPVLLLQGALDPLSDTVKKANTIREVCKNVQVEVLQAGHCGHDEVPDLVNTRMLSFLAKLHKETPAALVS